MTGTRIGHYDILEKIGQGGMGVVYKARDTHLDRLVAIKVLPQGFVGSEDHRRRFVREAKAASALNHPNIVTIYDVDRVDGIDFIAMEFIEGGTLDALLSAAPACAWRKRSAMLPKSRTPPPPLTRTASSTGT